MNYELAKKLEDAGFPQKIGKGEMYCSHGEIEKTRCKCYENCLSVYIPTLEELIDVCGKNITVSQKADGSWVTWKIYDFTVENSHLDIKENGKTHIEAMAKLYIKLNS